MGRRAMAPGMRIGALFLAMVGSMFTASMAAHAVTVENTPGVAAPREKFPEGARIYREQCAACHETGAGRAPARVILSYMTPNAILAALTDGAMKAQGSALSTDQKTQVAQHLSGREFGITQAALPEAPPCTPERARFDRTQVPAFAGGIERDGLGAQAVNDAAPRGQAADALGLPDAGAAQLDEVKLAELTDLLDACRLLLWRQV